MAWTLATAGLDRADFIDREAVSAVPLAKNTSGLILSGEATGYMDVRRWPFLQIQGQCTDVGPAITLLIVWSEDAAGFISTNQVYCTFRQGAPFVDTIPNCGPYVNVLWVASDAAAHNGYASVMGRASPGFSGIGSSLGGNITQVVCERAFAPIAAGGTATHFANFVQHGMAVFSTQADAVGVVFVIRHLSVANVFAGEVALFGDAAAGTRQIATVALTTHMVSVDLFNTVGAIINCGFQLTLMPSAH